MVNQFNSKVVVSFVVGLSLVISAYIYNRPKQEPITQVGSLSVITPEVSLREPISVTDKNNDGIEDWQEVFLSSDSFVGSVITTTDYEIPKTLTDQFSIEFFEDMVRSKGYGPFGQGSEELVLSKVAGLNQYAADLVYNTRDINIIPGVASADEIRLYANAHANVLIYNQTQNNRTPVEVLEDVVNGDIEALIEFTDLSNVYLKARDEALKIPVPESLAKEHLDLINVYNALYNDILGMSKVIEDPLISLLRIKRYPEDSQALVLALENMFFALEPYMDNFTRTDNGFYFKLFDPANPLPLENLKR